MVDKKKLYIANDIEAAGSLVGIHSVLSWGACVVTEKPLSKKELIAQGLVYYDELQPISLEFEEAAIRVGASGLRILEDGGRLPCYNPKSPHFEPKALLQLLDRLGTHPIIATRNFQEWIATVGEGYEVDPVVDTVFFDSTHLQYYFSRFTRSRPYGYAGTDMDSLFRGYRKDLNASLSDASKHIDRGIHHNSLDDSIFLAHTTREIVFNGTFS
ncbi:MAG TPA: hypothetical protein VJB70_01640 [Candidatus Paceibacterota bacterium]